MSYSDGYQEPQYVYPGATKDEPHYKQDTRTEIDRALAKKKKRHKIKAVPTPIKSDSPGSTEALIHFLKTPAKKRDASVLDDIIYAKGIADVDFSEIARQVGLPVAEVMERYRELLRARNSFTDQDYRLHIAAQLKACINSMQEAAQHGSVDHAKIWLMAIERLMKLQDLESDKANMTINIITHEQTNVFVGAVNLVVQRLLENPQIAKVPDIYEIVATGIEEAQTYVMEAQEKKFDMEGLPVVV